MKFQSKFLLFCSSYSPLFIIIIIKILNIQIFNKNGFIILINSLTVSSLFILSLCIIFIVLGIIGLIIIFNSPNYGANDIDVKSADNKTDMIYSYFLPYVFSIIPFFDSTSINNFSNILILVILFSVMFLVYTNSDLYLLNPVLTFKQYKYYKVTTKNNDVIVVISKINLKKYENGTIKAKFIDTNLYKYEGE